MSDQNPETKPWCWWVRFHGETPEVLSGPLNEWRVDKGSYVHTVCGARIEPECFSTRGAGDAVRGAADHYRKLREQKQAEVCKLDERVKALMALPRPGWSQASSLNHANGETEAWVRTDGSPGRVWRTYGGSWRGEVRLGVDDPSQVHLTSGWCDSKEQAMDWVERVSPKAEALISELRP